MAWKAVHKYARISPTKVRLVVDLIRGRDVNEALNILKFTPNRAATLIKVILTSAIANADEGEADVERLVIEEAYANEATPLKRWKLKDRGRIFPIRKRNSHITIVVEEA